MRGCFVDTNVLRYWRDGRPEVLDHLRALPDGTPLWISVVTWGEVEYGFRVLGSSESVRNEEVAFKTFVRDKKLHIQEITQHTVTHYGLLRARLFDKFVPNGKRKRGLRPEQLVDPVTSLELGVQENDLWIAAQAMEYNFILATGDKMHRINKVISDLLTIENWLTS